MSERYDSGTVAADSVRGTRISAEEAQKAWASGDRRGRCFPKTHEVMFDEAEEILVAFAPEQETVRIDRAELARTLAGKDIKPLAAARDAMHARMIDAIDRAEALTERTPGHVPSGMAQRSIAQGLREAAAADRARRAKRLREIAKTAVVVLAAVALALVVSAAFMGCASPAADYVHAEKAAWDEFDAQGNLDRWVDQEPTFSEGKKDALHQLNVARRIRVAHAVAAVDSK